MKLKNTWLYKLIKFNPDFLTIPLLFMGWLFAGAFFRFLDPESRIASPEYAGNFIAALFYLMAMVFFVKGFIRFHVPWLWEYLVQKGDTGKTDIHIDFENLKSWQKLGIFFGLLVFLLVFFYHLVTIIK